MIVVCDGPDGETQGLASVYQPSYWLRWQFHHKNWGCGTARNTGVTAAAGDLVLFLDDDTIAPADWLCMHRRAHTHDRQVVLGKYETRYSRAPQSHAEALVRRLNEEWIRGVWAKLERADAGAEEEYWVGLNCSLRRETYLSVGGADPELRIQEEASLAVKLLERGVEFVFSPSILIYHDEPKDIVADRQVRAGGLGRSDVYRLQSERPRSAPPKFALLVGQGPVTRQIIEQVCWRAPRLMSAVAKVCRGLAELTGSETLLKTWAVLSFSTAYWQGVREQGIASPPEVRRLLHEKGFRRGRKHAEFVRRGNAVVP